MERQLLDKNVVAMGWVSFFTDLSSAMMMPIVPVFMVMVLKEGADKVGLVIAVATFLSYGVRFVSGYISDKYQIVKPLVVGGYAVSAIIKPLYGISTGWVTIACLTGLERLGKGLRSAPRDVLINTYSMKRKEGYTFGFHKMMDIGGEFVGSLLLFVILLAWGQSEGVLRALFMLTLIPSVIGLLLMMFWVKDAPVLAKSPSSTSDDKTSLWRVLFEQNAQLMPTLLLHFAFLFFMLDVAFFTLRATEAGLQLAYIPLLFMVSTGVQTLISLYVGKKIDQFGARKLLLLGYLSGVIAQLMLLVGGPLIWLAYALMGVFAVVTLNAIRAIIGREAVRKGAIYGFFYAGIALTAGAGAYISGLIWHTWGSSVSLTISLIGCAVTGVILMASPDSTVFAEK